MDTNNKHTTHKYIYIYLLSDIYYQDLHWFFFYCHEHTQPFLNALCWEYNRKKIHKQNFEICVIKCIYAVYECDFSEQKKNQFYQP